VTSRNINTFRLHNYTRLEVYTFILPQEITLKDIGCRPSSVARPPTTGMLQTELGCRNVLLVTKLSSKCENKTTYYALIVHSFSSKLFKAIILSSNLRLASQPQRTVCLRHLYATFSLWSQQKQWLGLMNKAILCFVTGVKPFHTKRKRNASVAMS